MIVAVDTDALAEVLVFAGDEGLHAVEEIAALAEQESGAVGEGVGDVGEVALEGFEGALGLIADSVGVLLEDGGGCGFGGEGGVGGGGCEGEV